MARKSVFSLPVVSVKLNVDFKLLSDKPLENPRDVYRLAGDLLRNNDRESIIVFNLRADGRPASCHIAGVGTIDSCVAHPREMLKSTLLTNSSSIILAHNHPSGDVQPSTEDILLTFRMSLVCEMMQIKLLDHIIIGGGRGNRYYSMLDEGILEKKPSGLIGLKDEYVPTAAERRMPYGSRLYEGRNRNGKIR